MPISVIYVQGGVVTVIAVIDDTNQLDTHSVTWHADDIPFVDLDADGLPSTFEFDPEQLNSGTYGLSVQVTENNTGELFEVAVEVTLVVETALIGLSAENDADDDGISDADEGYADSDRDGIADYLDDDSTTSRLPIGENTEPMQTVNGLQLSLGDVARSAYGAVKADASIYVVDITRNGGKNGSAVDNSIDGRFLAVSSIINFNVSGLSSPGETVPVVIPLATDIFIPEGAVYRKYTEATGWFSFVVDGNNSVSSALKDSDGK